MRTARKRRSCCLSIILLLFVILAGLAGTFAWFYQNPIQNAALNERVLRRLERISGLNVVYDSAKLTIATGEYEIRNLQFFDKATSGPAVLTIGEVLARVHPWEIVQNPEAVITSVVLKQPSILDLEYAND